MMCSFPPRLLHWKGFKSNIYKHLRVPPIAVGGTRS